MAKSTSNFGGKQAAPFKSGGGRNMGHANTAKGTPRKSATSKGSTKGR